MGHDRMSLLTFRWVSWKRLALIPFAALLISAFLPRFVSAGEAKPVTPNNFSLPGIIDLPTARRFPDGELVVTQQIHN